MSATILELSGKTRELSQKIHARLFPAKRIAYNQSFPPGRSIPQGESWVAA
jgi:hypothetical protein